MPMTLVTMAASGSKFLIKGYPKTNAEKERKVLKESETPVNTGLMTLVDNRKYEVFLATDDKTRHAIFELFTEDSLPVQVVVGEPVAPKVPADTVTSPAA